MLAVIPARGGSVGLPGKNIRLLGGKPLIAHTIEAAVESGVFNKVLVSTDDPAIAEVSLSYGADVPFMRPPELATNEAKGLDVLVHAVEWLKQNEHYTPEIITLLQPTSPFRDSRTIIEAYDLFRKENAARLVSLCEAVEHYYWMYSLGEGRIAPVADAYYSGHRRQDLPKAYSLNGALYMGRLDTVMKEMSFVGKDTLGFVMTRIRSVDINDVLDFSTAELILERGMLNE
jgi:N-acylneuraminate cytidylyltransferase/CMP-N,N'-diacetyllegionaminic acid synthase